ncbi:YybH family protein [Shewanella donghaensis]|uniref:YybH family protein n=1 Tax=Shewanella donghaensis TaxID=238836 RepID=UPI001878FC33|nr:DUF4440 domain-containing protein [Shewanella donghaensis]
MTHFKILFIYCISLVSFFSNADTLTDNQLINKNYKIFASGFESLDLSMIENIYADNAVYISEVQDKGIVTGKSDIFALYQEFFKKIAKKDAHIEVDFRVVSRKLTADNSTDAGYYLVKFHPRKETGDPSSVFSGKFVFVSRKGPDNQWKFTLDSNTRSNSTFYFAAKPVPNLYYGRQFNPEIEPVNIESLEQQP